MSIAEILSRVDRLKNLSKLALSRKVSTDMLIQQLGLNLSSHGKNCYTLIKKI